MLATLGTVYYKLILPTLDPDYSLRILKIDGPDPAL